MMKAELIQGKRESTMNISRDWAQVQGQTPNTQKMCSLFLKILFQTFFSLCFLCKIPSDDVIPE